MAQRVAVIGAGVAGSFCAQTIKQLRPHASVDVFEMGFSLGGRVACRRSRDETLANLRIAHGTPAFVCESAEFRAALDPLLRSGAVRDVGGASLGLLHWDKDAAAATTAPATSSSSSSSSSSTDTTDITKLKEKKKLVKAEPADPVPLLADAGGRMCAELLEGAAATVHRGAKIDGVKWDSQAQTWSLYVAGGAKYEGYSALAVSSVTPGHGRWRDIFGAEPPLEALRSLPCRCDNPDPAAGKGKGVRKEGEGEGEIGGGPTAIMPFAKCSS